MTDNLYDILNAEYVLNTRDIRNGYALFYGDGVASTMSSQWIKATVWAEQNFDRWLNEELAKAWDAGQQSGAQWGVTQWDEEGIITSENPYRKAD